MSRGRPRKDRPTDSSFVRLTRQKRGAPAPAAEPRERLASGKMAPLVIAKHESDVARVTLFDLANDHCRWPCGEIGAPGFGFCGKPEADLSAGRPYCPAHTARAANPYALRPITVPGSIKPSTKSFSHYERELSRNQT